MEQGTPEWHEARLGRVTASRIADVMMNPTTAGFQNYRSQLVCERLTGTPTETFTSAAMQHGTETEPQARAMYTLATGLSVNEVGFVPHPLIEMAGASPDGLVGELGLVEIKCPQPTEHIRVLTGGDIKKGYVLQMLWQMECTGREWCDFVSFNPDLPDDLQLYIQRVEYDSEKAREITDAVRSFLTSVDDTFAKLRTLQEAA
ncbi:Exonuclease [Ruegeria sp. TM1040]|uniref:lambda exonuclease family protein n=1 Tax=Ruegeria sp. (strain TM1040) TaxID=292414 RepID=UPI0000462661|nr:lambda exonuclease family protein [Ruegeria sp. TM1040]ABF63516.1 Exonuclease [Ruegeria sp. TM1040]